MTFKYWLGALVPAMALLGAVAAPASAFTLNRLGGAEVDGGAEISAFDADTANLFVTTGDTIEIFNLSTPSVPAFFGSIDLTDPANIGGFVGGGVNSVAFSNGILAAAIEADTKQDDGIVAFFDASGNFQSKFDVGALPDMLTFTPDGAKVLVANEGEPSDEYDVDPEGSVSIIDIASGSVKDIGFDGVAIGPDVRIFGPGATPGQDLEPEYIAVSEDGATAYVALQENNALGILDLESEAFTGVTSLGFKDHSVAGNGFDASNEDDGINIQTHPVLGMYQPDAIATYTVNGETYVVTANEGDARDYDGFSEEVRVADLTLDPSAYPNASELQQEENLGRLKTTTTLGDTDGDGDVDQIYSYGARSFSIWDAQGNLVFDSGDDFEQIIAADFSEFFNINDGDPEEFDQRSDDKGPEPEGVTIGFFGGRTLAFIGLERSGGVMVYDITNPTAPSFVTYEPSFQDDVSPEGLLFINEEDSPIGQALLVVSNEESSTFSVYQAVPEPGTLVGLLGGVAALFGIKRQRRS
ncbi:choice-of-anchor I family protein [Leptothoe kymatousa]|uniref:Choice-of-anchor I family protein n=1 Tax=Leptothoe kymatousa TAU-MAC 1615 TaxID=2364775 RepID=A0ABS5Y3H6_9CYAN|nr:choice-of-anchor I family protein [Leptothoe kymatousa]MBT9312377.1 choice-of-anchor I family protein [Leptothoe kymatousa TAU-MAC 1615]